MHRFKPTAFNLPGFLYFIFRDFRDLIRLLMGTWAMAMAIWAVRDDARYSSPDPAMSALGGAFIGCLAGLLLAYVLLFTYRLWAYLHYRVRPRLKTWWQGHGSVVLATVKLHVLGLGVIILGCAGFFLLLWLMDYLNRWT